MSIELKSENNKNKSKTLNLRKKVKGRQNKGKTKQTKFIIIKHDKHTQEVNKK